MKPTACSESHEHDLESSGSGTGGASKTDEFSEKFQGKGSFSIQKIIGFWTLKPYMQKTCDVAVRLFWPKKICRKSA